MATAAKKTAAARAATPAAEGAAATYVVVSPILYDAATKRAEPGEEIELTEDEALSYGAALKPKAAAETKKDADKAPN